MNKLSLSVAEQMLQAAANHYRDSVLLTLGYVLVTVLL